MSKKYNLFIICLVGLLSNAGIGLVFPIFAGLLFDPSIPLVPPDTSAETRGFLFGLLIALTPLLHFFSASILGTLSDRHGRKSILQHSIAIGIIGYVIATIGLMTNNLVLLFVYRALNGIADGATSVAQAAVSDLSDETNKTRYFSLYNAGLGIGFTIGPFMGGVLSDPTFGYICCYTTPFVVTGCLLFLNWVLITLHFPESGNRELNHKKINLFEGIHNLRKAFVMKDKRLLFFAVFAFCFGWSFFAEFIPLTLIEKFSFSSSQIGQYFAYLGLWYALSNSFLTSILVRRFSENQLLVKALLLGACFMPLFLLIKNPLLIMFYTPPLMFIIALVYPSMSTLVSNTATKEQQGSIMGIYQSVFALAVGLSPLLGGSIVAAYPDLTIWGGAVFLLMSSLSFWWHLKQKPMSVSEN